MAHSERPGPNVNKMALSPRLAPEGTPTFTPCRIPAKESPGTERKRGPKC